MSKLEDKVAAGLPWLSAAGAVAMTGAAVAKWPKLDAVNRVAFGLDAVVYAAAVLPLARRSPAGWWALYLATVLQPVFGGIEAAQDRARWPSAAGRTAGAVVVAAGLLGMRKSYA
ncbi:hypothetical protein [Actinocorallia populi]|uniref:hypothetical protein n=1 Tax=Actinocorallia populi TaxID=2079200 RepID=UPI000D09404D|nr:hypothetical protein [Actinocorallia populi]